MSKRNRAYRPQPMPKIDHKLLAAEVVKASGFQLALPPGATATAVSPYAQQNAGMMAAAMAGLTHRLPWTQPNVAFGPGVPIAPGAIDPNSDGTGRPMPRRFEYPVSFNLPGGSDRMVPWTVLRRLADNVDILRRCIEIRKNETTSLEWDIAVSESAVELAMIGQSDSTYDRGIAKAAAAGDPQAKADQNKKSPLTKFSIEKSLRDANAQSMAQLRRFWEYPDRINHWSFAEWLSVALEEHFVLDALAIYAHPNLAGDLHSLEIIAGDTIKPLIDYRGSTPQPPNPAYQQILYGFPRGEFTADPGANDQFTADTLLYRPRYRRANSMYGFGNTEQAITLADLYLKRQDWLRAEYTNGVTPEMLINVTAPGWSPEQLKAYETIFNDDLSGRTADRHRARFLPEGMVAERLASFEERYSTDLDEFLIKLLANSFDVMPSEIGITPKSGLGGAGHQSGEENTTYRKGTRPMTKWLTSIINDISARFLGMGDQITFQFLGLESEDEESAMAVLEQEMRNGLRTFNEGRDVRGLPRYDIPDADVPMIVTTRDVIPIEGAVDRASAPPPAALVPGAVPQKESVTVPRPTTGAAQKAAEADAFKTYVRNVARRGRPWRDFTFSEHDEPVGKAANLLAAGGDTAAALEALRVSLDD